ncbi:hypothetical protein ACFQU1_20520 [Chelatococcus sp. GCM10030263]|uniref:hypothetical protein n=1 Tax=Chelatococcus sp. GCM10030263 TaxID=3273387 RepID=UPI0036113D46
MDFLIAGDATGRIVHVAQADNTAALQADYESRGQPCVVISTDSRRFYLKDGQLVPRPKSTAVLSAAKVPAGSGVTLTGAPAGAAIAVTGPVQASIESDGELVALTFPLAGLYTITVEHWPERDANFLLEVTP